MILRKSDKGSLVAQMQEKLGITADGIFGAGTEAAVEEFQKEKNLRVDGIAGPNTLFLMGLDFSKYIIGGTDKNVSWELPESGTGFRTYNRESRGDQFGVKETIEKCIEIARKWHCLNPEINIQFGDVSRLYGGKFPPHGTHRTGKDVDMRPFRNDGEYLGVEYVHKEYSQELTREFLLLVRGKARVYFNDADLISEGLCSFARGHGNHLHIMF